MIGKFIDALKVLEYISQAKDSEGKGVWDFSESIAQIQQMGEEVAPYIVVGWSIHTIGVDAMAVALVFRNNKAPKVAAAFLQSEEWRDEQLAILNHPLCSPEQFWEVIDKGVSIWAIKCHLVYAVPAEDYEAEYQKIADAFEEHKKK